MVNQQLLDQSIQNYFINWDGETFTGRLGTFPDQSLEITGEQGNSFGFLESVRLGGTRILLKDNQKDVLLQAEKTFGFSGRNYKIRDWQDNVLGNSKGDFVLSLKRKMIMKNTDNKELLQVLGSHDPPGVWIFTDVDKKIIAELEISIDVIKKKGFWNVDHKNHAVLKIKDKNFDRKTLLGFFISLFNSFVDGD